MWSSDITYIATDEGWLYLTAVLDRFSRQLVGWSMKQQMQASVVTDAMRMAWFRHRPAPGLIFHSDRGSQYCRHEFLIALDAGLRQSDDVRATLDRQRWIAARQQDRKSA